MLIKRICELEPLTCPECGGQMAMATLIEPLQGKVTEEILRHCGLWQASAPRLPPDVDGLVHKLDFAYLNNRIGSPGQADPSQELTYVDIDTFLDIFWRLLMHVGS